MPILVIGSSNTDMVVKTSRLPAPGETVLGGQFLMNPGGKGANQAVAAARLAGQVTFVAKVGNDLFGRQAVQGFRQEDINTDFILTDADLPSGVALINVDNRGENSITVASGANGNLQPAEVNAAIDAADAATIVLLQLETPLQTVTHAVKRAHQRGLRVLLNPAPAQVLPDSFYAHLFAITPNETEAELLTGVRVVDAASLQTIADIFHQRGLPTVIITLGANGAFWSDGQTTGRVTAPIVTAVDSTAAGDCFNGALAVALAEGQCLPDAIAFAVQAASLSVMRLGAQASMPTRAEL